MEHWNVQPCVTVEGDYYLLNRTRTPIKVNSRIQDIDIAEIMALLEEVEFPLLFTEGLELVNFTYIRGGKTFGYYQNDEITIDCRKKRKVKTILATLIHEIAHHVDSEIDASRFLLEESKERWMHIHKRARNDPEEYFARGFEYFYSLDKQDRKNLRQNCPKLYRMLLKLHKEFRSK